MATLLPQDAVVATSDETQSLREELFENRHYDSSRHPNNQVVMTYDITYIACPTIDTSTGRLTSPLREKQVSYRLYVILLDLLARHAFIRTNRQYVTLYQSHLAVAVLGLSVGGRAVGAMVFGRGHSIGTTTGLLLRTILCKSFVLVPRVNFVENTQNMHARKSIVKEF